MKALIVSGDKFEDTELLVPLYRLLEEKIETDIASLSATTITGKHGYKVVATVAIVRQFFQKAKRLPLSVTVRRSWSQQVSFMEDMPPVTSQWPKRWKKPEAITATVR